jgi:hypothetical protein
MSTSSTKKGKSELVKEHKRECYDFVELEDKKIDEHLSEPDNIILTDTDVKSMACSSIIFLQKMIDTPVYNHYQCDKVTGKPDKTVVFVKIPMSFDVTVMLDELLLAIEHKAEWKFMTFDDTNVMTGPLIVKERADAGAIYCDPNLNAKIYSILTYNLDGPETSHHGTVTQKIKTDKLERQELQQREVRAIQEEARLRAIERERQASETRAREETRELSRDMERTRLIPLWKKFISGEVHDDYSKAQWISRQSRIGNFVFTQEAHKMFNNIIDAHGVVSDEAKGYINHIEDQLETDRVYLVTRVCIDENFSEQEPEVGTPNIMELFGSPVAKKIYYRDQVFDIPYDLERASAFENRYRIKNPGQVPRGYDEYLKVVWTNIKNIIRYCYLEPTYEHVGYHQERDLDDPSDEY